MCVFVLFLDKKDKKKKLLLNKQNICCNTSKRQRVKEIINVKVNIFEIEIFILLKCVAAIKYSYRYALYGKNVFVYCIKMIKL